ncbi:hypothetical protein LCI18_012771 [Fusarium solani-melongenae]|uniref:Uncharacterized protein n=1 Tax=Fusarium solani subsp. cucurbitae TaxID=2747967 RepID=A0ACD3ZL61_FUSSC|nr:hypothetical protein LCI18_012771 [Fusarium solani-melongenae]
MGVFKLSLEYLALRIAASYQLIPRSVTWCVLGLEGEVQKCLSEQDPKCITRCRHTQLMDSWLTGCEQTISTDLTGTAFNEAARLDARLTQIELQHTAALESHAKEIERQAGKIKKQAGDLSEMDELIVNCGGEFSRIENDADNVNRMLLGFERQVEKHAARQDAKLNELEKTDSNATRLAAIEARLAKLETMLVGLVNNQNTEKMGNMAV